MHTTVSSSVCSLLDVQSEHTFPIEGEKLRSRSHQPRSSIAQQVVVRVVALMTQGERPIGSGHSCVRGVWGRGSGGHRSVRVLLPLLLVVVGVLQIDELPVGAISGTEEPLAVGQLSVALRACVGGRVLAMPARMVLMQHRERQRRVHCGWSHAAGAAYSFAARKVAVVAVHLVQEPVVPRSRAQHHGQHSYRSRNPGAQALQKRVQVAVRGEEFASGSEQTPNQVRVRFVAGLRGALRDREHSLRGGGR
mmetsp:Transcript_15824/g.47510  ORF Transcript_15824/g.47510 Transcript_15824/m.47510 type:complete len:250 (-) Transcript_15824:1130-1879(-)